MLNTDSVAIRPVGKLPLAFWSRASSCSCRRAGDAAAVRPGAVGADNPVSGQLSFQGEGTPEEGGRAAGGPGGSGRADATEMIGHLQEHAAAQRKRDYFQNAAVRQCFL